jgi:hypothetical protein
VQRELTCHTCASPLQLLRGDAPNYKWECPKHCLPPIDTGVSIGQQLDDLRPDESGTVEFNASHFFPPMTPSRIATAKVFMPQILYHFISCTWGGCYNSLYSSVLVPHLDAPQVLDYVLRSPAVRDGPGVQEADSGARMYPELRRRLEGVASLRVRAYLEEHFPTAGL